MPRNKTAPTGEDVHTWLQRTTDGQKLEDSLRLIALMRTITGAPAYMWGPSIIGFGKYSYTYNSGHSSEAPLLGFSPRKSAISLYVFTGLKAHEPLLENLGKYTRGRACIYAKRLSDLNEPELVKLMQATVDWVKQKWG